MGTSQLPPSPQPTVATINTLGGSAECTFDLPLNETGPWNAANWFAITGGFLWACSNVAIAGSVVTLTVAADSPSLDPEGLYFAPPPFDVKGTNGQSVAAFGPFPLT